MSTDTSVTAQPAADVAAPAPAPAPAMQARAPALIDLLNYAGLHSLPMVYQSEGAECGLACLSMVAGFHGQQVPLSTLRHRYAIPLSGATLAQLMEVGAGLGMYARPLRGEIDELHTLRMPAILHWNMNHFVVLKAVKRTLSGKRFIVHDPARGVASYSEAEISRHWTGVCLEMHPTTTFEQHDLRPKMNFSQLGLRLDGFKSLLLQIVALSVLLQLFAFVTPFYLQLAVDKAVPALDQEFLVALALGFATVSLVSVTTFTLREWLTMKLGNAMGFAMVSDLFRHMLKLPIGYFERRQTGDLLSRFGSTKPVTDFLTHGVVGGAIDGFMALLTLGMMFYFSPVLAAVAIAALLAYLLIRVGTYRIFMQANNDRIAASADEQGTMIETVRGMTTIKLFGRELDRMRMWQNKHAKTVNTDMREQRLNMWFNAANSGILQIESVVFVYLAVSMVIGGSFTIGMMFAFQAYKGQFLGAAMRLVGLVIDYRMLRLHIDRIADIAAEKAERQDGPSKASVFTRPFRGKIELRNVSFSYGSDTPLVIDGIDLTIDPGESVAITGLSGGGKTTLMKLLLGMYEPTGGEILIDDQPLSRMGLANYRKHIAAVLQDDVLYAGSIAENISFFDGAVDHDRLQACAEAACIHDEIAAFPMSYDTLVGDMGSTLSGGQRQRVFLARALYQEPWIMMLDEGTANLDVETEKHVNDLVASLPITRILIAHREATILSADRAVEMRKGKLYPLERRRIADTRPAPALERRQQACA